jgi:CubicO group peptidase (beta-lactamase class C family)
VRKRILAAAAVLLGGAVTAAADPIDAFVHAQMEKRHIPALSLAVIRDGKAIKLQDYGRASVELDVPASAQTVYEIGSMSKQFTAAAILLLVEEGKLDLEAHVTQLLPGLPDAWSPITVRHLLTHTSGIQNFTRTEDHDKKHRLAVSLPEVIATVAAQPLDFPRGSRWSYCNTGYTLLGMIVEKVGGEPYGDFVRRRIFAPLGMTSTRLNDSAELITGRAAGYTWDGHALHNAEYEDPSWPYAGGGVLSTIADLIRWDAALDAGTLLKRASIAAMWTPARLADGSEAVTDGGGGYGFGWQIEDDRGHPLVWHTGHIYGFSSVIQRFVDDHLTVIVLTNESDAQPDQIAHGIAGLVLPALQPPSAAAIRPDPDPAQQARLRAALADLAAGASPGGLVTPGYLAAADPGGRARVGGLLKGLVSMGFQGCETGHGRAVHGAPVDRICHYKMTAPPMTVFMHFFLTADGTLALVTGEPE